MPSVFRVTCLAVVVLVVVAATARAQDDTPRETNDGKHGAALSLFGGGVTGSTGTGGALGWSVDWLLTRRVSFEGSGWWTAEPAITGFSALFGPRFDIGGVRRAIPFVSTEVGVYHAAVDTSSSKLPAYYTRRMTGPSPRDTFDDFAAGIGGGVDIGVKRHLSLRPQVRLVLMTDGDGVRPLALYGVHFSYNFVEKPHEP